MATQNIHKNINSPTVRRHQQSSISSKWTSSHSHLPLSIHVLFIWHSVTTGETQYRFAKNVKINLSSKQPHRTHAADYTHVRYRAEKLVWKKINTAQVGKT